MLYVDFENEVALKLYYSLGFMESNKKDVVYALKSLKGNT
jgi:predicted GNAT family acetyltransferase